MFSWQILLYLLMSQNDCIPSLLVFREFNQLPQQRQKSNLLLEEEKKEACRHYGDKSRTAQLCGWYINSSGLFHFPPLSGVNQGGKERTVTSACPFPAVCTAHVRRHGSVSARRAGWAACVTKVSLIKLPDMSLSASITLPQR